MGMRRADDQHLLVIMNASYPLASMLFFPHLREINS